MFILQRFQTLDKRAACILAILGMRSCIYWRLLLWTIILSEYRYKISIHRRCISHLPANIQLSLLLLENPILPIGSKKQLLHSDLAQQPLENHLFPLGSIRIGTVSTIQKRPNFQRDVLATALEKRPEAPRC